MPDPQRPAAVPPPTASASTPDLSAASSSESHGGGPAELRPLPLDLVTPQFTLRAVLTGMVLAAVLSACNVYTGLKIGWSLNMSITAALIGYGFWTALQGFGVRRWTILENNINQTACSSGASVSSAGLVAPIPALAMLTGTTLTWHFLALWVFSVCMVGITVAIALRRQMLLVDKLPFVSGIAAAETLRELYAKGAEALRRVYVLVAGALIAGPILWVQKMGAAVLGWGPPQPYLPGRLTAGGFGLKSLTFGFDTSLLMYGVGALVGTRACVSILVGAILAWGIMAPRLINGHYLRLAVSEPLPVKPVGLDLPPEPHGYTKYDDNSRQLEHKGEMSADERDALLAKSDDVFYQEAVRKLYVRSQLAYAKQGQEIPPAVVDDLTTTVRLQASVPLTTLPRGTVLPRELGGRLRIDRDDRRLVVYGSLTPELATAATAAVREFQQQHPRQQQVADELLAAIAALESRAGTPYLPSSVAVPLALADRVTWFPEEHWLRITGRLSSADRALLLGMVPWSDPAYADFVATVGRLARGAQLTPVTPGFRDLVYWLLWPGVTLMVVASLTSFAFSWRSILHTFTGGKSGDIAAAATSSHDVTRTWFLTALVAALILSVALQISFFAIVWWAAIVGVLLTFVLAIVAARVSGETNITPVGAMGKVTQLIFGIMVPGQPAANLMSANVTGGAASQCADLLHDLKCGHLIGASPRLQSLAQICGAFAGAMAGAMWYLILIPNPRQQLMTDEWAAPAVAAWKAVAELFTVGFQAMPAGTKEAIIIAAIAAVVLVFIEKLVPKKWRPYTLSPASLGLAMVVHAHYGISMFVGGMVALVLSKLFPKLMGRFLITAAAGIAAGESLTGVGIALSKIDWGELLGSLVGG